MKPIVLTDELIQKMQEEFVKTLREAKLSDGGVKYEKKFYYPDDEGLKKAKILYTPFAMLKQRMLLDQFSTEVAWHGVVERRDDTTFVIKDVLVYPQEVTGSTVNTDQELYQKWMMELPDEVYNNLRAQIHSHVNFGTSPSVVDLTHQEKILGMMGKDDYYIFMIWNKKGEKTVKIYDLGNNILYENADIVVDVEDDGSEMSQLLTFMSKANELVKTKSYVSGNYSSGTGSYGYPSSAARTKKETGRKADKAGQQTLLSQIGGSVSGRINDPSRGGDDWYERVTGGSYDYERD